MKENKIFEALLDVVPFAAYAVDIETYEVVYANKLMSENMYDPEDEYCWKKVFGQNEICSWCTIPELKKRKSSYSSEKIISAFFNEATDQWLQSYDELVKWPDGRTVRYSIAVDITEQKEIQANMIKTHTKLAIQSKKLKDANKKLEYMATKDYLTGINNRASFFHLTNQIWNKQEEKNQKIFIAMLDLDKFKNINDTYGHKVGDETLKSFTKAVSSQLKEDDIFARLGGEEFAIVMKSSAKELVLAKLEKIRKNVEELIIPSKDKIVKFTVSIGLVEKEDSSSIDILLDEADLKLYKAKTTGRNRIC
jgi:diguanylate cyclase (GGDEF)-like protein